MARRSFDLAEIDTAPGWANKAVRLKYAHVSELLEETLTENANIARKTCEAVDYMLAHEDDPVEEVEAYLFSHPDWGWHICAEWIRNAPRYTNDRTQPHGDLACRMIQHDCALELVKHPWEKTRSIVEWLFENFRTRWVSPEALYVMLAYLNAHHPNPRAFLSLPKVREKLPPDLELERFAAPAFD